MKKNLICLCLILLVMFEEVCCGGSIVLRVGIVSDSQPMMDKKDFRYAAFENLEKSFLKMKSLGVDLVLFPGDLASLADDKEVYEKIRQIFSNVFTDEKPEFLVIMGNHDFLGNGRNKSLKRTPDDEMKYFMDMMGLKELNTHKVIGGYSFITLNSEDRWHHGTYGKKTADFFHEEMAKALKRKPEGPVFVITHQPPVGTVWADPLSKNAKLTELFKKYPQVVNFSGHSHFTIEDERSIHQKDFTAVGCASQAFGSCEKTLLNAPSYSKYLMAQMIYMTIDDKTIELRRYDIRAGVEIKPERRWRISLPLEKSLFTYTDLRSLKRSAPEFSPQAGAGATYNEDGSVKITFDAAVHDDFVYSYMITIWEKSPDGLWGKVAEDLQYASDFYNGIYNMKAKFELNVLPKVYSFKKQVLYRFDIVPVESFGKRGKALIVELSPE